MDHELLHFFFKLSIHKQSLPDAVNIRNVFKNAFWSFILVTMSAEVVLTNPFLLFF